jgi:hypothetical protein
LILQLFAEINQCCCFKKKKNKDKKSLMTEEFAARVGISLAAKIAAPFLAWIGARTLGLGAGRLAALSQGQQVGLLLAGMGGATYVLVQPEKSLDFLLGGVASVANTTVQVLGVVANQVRALDESPSGIPLETDSDSTDNVPAAQEEPVPLPLLPKDYTKQNFPFYFNSQKIRYIHDSDVDPLIEAYAVLGIDVVSMILQDHQLPQMKLVKEIYFEQIKHIHPDKNLDFEGATQLASLVNLAYTRIKNMMKSADEQADLITPVLQYFHKGYFPPTPYIILFFLGGAFVVWLS